MVPNVTKDRFIRNIDNTQVGLESILRSKWRWFLVEAVFVESWVWGAGVKGVGARAGNIPHGKHIDILQGDGRQGRG